MAKGGLYTAVSINVQGSTSAIQDESMRPRLVILDVGWPEKENVLELEHDLITSLSFLVGRFLTNLVRNVVKARKKDLLCNKNIKQ